LNATDIKAAREALDNMDDYARMNTGVNAIGPRKVLEDFISAAERAVSPEESVHDAARRAPDLSKLHRYTIPSPHRYCDIEVVALADVQALLAQPLQQEGGKDAPEGNWPKDFRDVIKGAEDAAYQQGRAAGIEEAAKVCENQCDPTRAATTSAYALWHAKAIRALAQPSDNLQQASTAQVETAKHKGPQVGAWFVRHYTGADWPVIKNNGIELECAGADREDAELIAATLNAAAQATPEGVHDERAAFEAWFSENVYSNPSYLNRRHDDQNTYVSDTVEARWIGWQARAALAASQQAAEPVGEVAHEQNWMTGLIHTYVKWAGEVPSKGTKLYRAAPPQQVDESGLPG
jgi:hypothetical protein